LEAGKPSHRSFRAGTKEFAHSGGGLSPGHWLGTGDRFLSDTFLTWRQLTVPIKAARLNQRLVPKLKPGRQRKFGKDRGR
jgi:hypothetical protein